MQSHDFVKDEDFTDNQYVNSSFKWKKLVSVKKKVAESYSSKYVFQNHLTKAHASINDTVANTEECNEVTDDLVKSLNSDRESTNSSNIENSVNSESALPCSSGSSEESYSLGAELQQHGKPRNIIKNENITDNPCIDTNISLQNEFIKNREILAKKKIVTCELCSKSYSSKCTYQRHFKTAHNRFSVLKQEPFVYSKHNDINNDHPVENLGNQEDIIKNAMKEKIEKWKASMTCEICNSSFTSKYKLSMHHLVHTGEEPVKCTLCNKSFPSRRRMHAHYKIHQTVKSFSCNVCFKLFRRTYDLNQHVQVHGSDRSFFCPICAKSFTNKQNCNKHVVRHSGLKPYTCDICNKSFAQVGSLKTHILVHSNERKHVCEICNKSFKILSALRRHYKSHLCDKRIYVCEICNNSYRTRLCYQAHLFKHTGEKPYSCEICNKGFIWRASLKKHSHICEMNKP